MPTHVTNYESDEGIRCHDHTGECRWTDSRAIWAAEIWTPLVRVCRLWKGGRPRQSKLTPGALEALGATDHETWTGTVVVGAARRHVLCSEGENVAVVLLRGVRSGWGGVVGTGGCCEKV